MKKITKLGCLLLITACVGLTGCKKNTIDDKTIIVGASASPHAEILRQCKDYIKENGYELEIKVYNDYIIPNQALDQEELDANFFQHLPYLNEWNEKENTNLVSALAVHYEPLGFYAGKSNSLESIKNGALIAVPNDTTNYARSLLLLHDLGIITVDETKGINITISDVLANPHKVNIKGFKAASIPAQLSEVDYAVINGNYALSANISKTKLLAAEDKDSLAATTYGNIIAVKANNVEKHAIKLLVEALSQPTISEYITNSYDGYVLPLI